MYGQRNYLGNMDQELLRQIVDYVPDSPYASVARRDPTFGPAAADFMYNLANPDTLSPDTATGVGQPLFSSREDDGPSVGEIVGGIATAPFRALGFVKQGLEDALGHRNSRIRTQEETQIEVATKLGLLSDALTREQKYAIFPDKAAEIDAIYAARSGQGGDGAMGRDTSMLPTPEPRKTGFMEWLTGQNRRIRDQQLAQAAMVQHALDQNYKTAQIGSEIAEGNLRNTKAEHERFLTDVDYRYLDRDRLLGQDKVRSEIGENNASAYSSYASGANSYASRDRTMQAIGLDRERNAREAEEARTDAVAARLGLRKTREQLRGEKLDNRKTQLELREREQQGPFGADTGYDKDGNPFNLRQFMSAYNAADKREKPGVAARYQVPMQTNDRYWPLPDTEEPDYVAMNTPPSMRAATETAPAEEPPKKSIAPPDPLRVEQIATVLRRAMPANSGRDADVQARAQDIQRMNLDWTTPEGFYDSAKSNGLSDQDIAILWNGVRSPQK